MKTKIRHFSCILMLTLCTSNGYAQSSTQAKEENLAKNTVSNNLPSTYYARITSWWDSGNGFICKTSVDNKIYLIRYDRQGKYVETLTQKVWNDTAALHPAFQQSQYRSQKVRAYWEVSDVNKKGYYLELNDSQNRNSGVWVDDQGVFSTIPATKAKH
jgi:hypothetical protein